MRRSHAFSRTVTSRRRLRASASAAASQTGRCFITSARRRRSRTRCTWRRSLLSRRVCGSSCELVLGRCGPRFATRSATSFRWTEQHADLARFVYSRGHLEWESPAASDVAALNRSLAAAFSDWLAPLIRSGQVRPLSMLLVTAIVSGPAHAIARRWLAGQLDRPPSAFLDELSDAAWAALRGKPGRRAGAAASTCPSRPDHAGADRR